MDGSKTIVLNDNSLKDYMNMESYSSVPEYSVCEDGIYQRERGNYYKLVLSKEAFIEAYNKYIMNN